ncbi:ABC transporter permease [Candidatus Sumerlaeota bacterium]|nr:ABC transporter permease [Candidatus Sumerlaeota bacterium]
MIVTLVRHIGVTIMGINKLLGQAVFFVQDTIRAIFCRPLYSRQYTEQMIKVGICSMPIANLTAFFVGMVILLQTGYQLQQFGAKLYSAGITTVALTREMVPVFTAMVVGSRVAASIAAELGSMKITEQIDAMNALSVNPFKYLIAPRVIASTIMLPLIAIYANIVGYLGGLLVGTVLLDITPRLYYNYSLKFVSFQDIITGLSKTFVFGAIIGIVGCFYGFRTSGGAEGVGKSTTSAVVTTLILILIFDYILSSWILFFTGMM